MAFRSTCTACLRLVTPQLQAVTSRSGDCLARRTFSLTSRRNHSSSEPRRSQPPDSAIFPKTGPEFNHAKSPRPDQSQGESTTVKVARELRKAAPGLTETYVAYGVCEELFKECASQADYSIPRLQEKGTETPKTKDGEDLGVGEGWWYETLGLKPTFNTWAQVTFLHMYLLTARFRCFGPEYAPAWHQHLLDHFFYKAEDRMTVEHNVHSRAIRNKYLKDLFSQWRGLTAGYDEGIARGDAVLAAAVWRNVFKADAEVDFKHLGIVVSYLRAVLKGLDSLSDEAIASGQIKFGSPGEEEALVVQKSELLDAPFEEEEVEPIEKGINQR